MADFLLSWATAIWSTVSMVGLQTWLIFYDSAFYILAGFVFAGLLHEFVPASLIVRHLGRNDFRSIVMAAIFGAPVPLCSCSVLPTALALREKGASKPAIASFLISVPETDLENVSITYGLMGPLMAVYRPIAGTVTAIAAGLLTLLMRDRREDRVGTESLKQFDLAEVGHTHGDDCCGPGDEGHDHAHHDHAHHDHSHGHAPTPELVLEPAPIGAAPMGRRLNAAMRYGFVNMLDEIAFWITFGLVLTGVMIGLLPGDFFTRVGLGSGIVPMLLMILISVPIYTCASASTPVGAGLIATGLSPGAALVFLLCGPATSMATIPIIGRILGARLLLAYLAALISVAIAAGLLLDWLFADIVREAVVAGRSDVDGPVWAAIKTASTIVFLLMLIASFRRGSFAIGYADLKGNMKHLRVLAEPARWDWFAPARRGFSAVAGEDLSRRLGALDTPAVRRRTAGAAIAAVVTAAVIYAAPAFTLMVGVGEKGIIQRFGRVVARDLEPGIYFHLPAPLGRGLAVDTASVAQISVDTMRDFSVAEDDQGGALTRSYYLTSDENVIDIQAMVQYTVSDAYKASFVIDGAEDLIRSIAYDTLVSLTLEMPIDRIYSDGRAVLEARFQELLRDRVKARDFGYEILAARLAYIHAPAGVHDAFRDLASAIEDKSRMIFEANGNAALLGMQTGGKVAEILAAAKGDAFGQVKAAEGRALPFSTLAAVHARAPVVTEERLRLESIERSLAAPMKFMNGAGLSEGQVDLWIESGKEPAVKFSYPN